VVTQVRHDRRRRESRTEPLGRPIAFAEASIELVRQYSKDMALMLEWFERGGYTADIAGLAREFGALRAPGSAAAACEHRSQRVQGRPDESALAWARAPQAVVYRREAPGSASSVSSDRTFSWRPITIR